MLSTLCPVIQAQQKLGAQFVESVFYRAALEAGFGHGSEQRARELYQMYSRVGYSVELPEWVRKFIEKVNTKGA